jgi:hypothetical protein
MDGIARGKRRNEASRAEVEWVIGALGAIRSGMGTDQEVADALGVSRNAWKKWMAKDSYPATANFNRIREVLQEVRARAPKVAPDARSPVQTAEPGVLASAIRDGHEIGTRLELTHMGALLSAVNAGEEPTYLLELEICLWYHRDEVDRGEISRTVISLAKEGFFEDLGCQSWVARDWWPALLQHDSELRGKLRRLRPGKPIDPKH